MSREKMSTGLALNGGRVSAPSNVRFPPTSRFKSGFRKVLQRIVSAFRPGFKVQHPLPANSMGGRDEPHNVPVKQVREWLPGYTVTVRLQASEQNEFVSLFIAKELNGKSEDSYTEALRTLSNSNPKFIPGTAPALLAASMKLALYYSSDETCGENLRKEAQGFIASPNSAVVISVLANTLKAGTEQEINNLPSEFIWDCFRILYSFSPASSGSEIDLAINGLMDCDNAKLLHEKYLKHGISLYRKGMENGNKAHTAKRKEGIGGIASFLCGVYPTDMLSKIDKIVLGETIYIVNGAASDYDTGVRNALIPFYHHPRRASPRTDGIFEAALNAYCASREKAA